MASRMAIASAVALALFCLHAGGTHSTLAANQPTTSGANAMAAKIPTAAEMIGSWELLGLDPADEKGNPVPRESIGVAATLQPDTGEISIFPDGRVFVLMSRRARSAAPPSPPGTQDGFFAMRGTYTYNESDGLLTYTPDVASDVRREKRPFRRWATLDGDRLTLRTEKEQMDSYWLVRWQKIPARK